MKSLLLHRLPVLFLAVTALMSLGFTNLVAGDLLVEAQLVWGTNAESSPNPKHKSAEPIITEKLGKTGPFKWKHYFEEERKSASLATDSSKKLEMSKDAVVEIKNLGKGIVEMKLIGEGKDVVKTKGKLASGEILAIGGESRDDAAWFVVLRKVESKQ